MKSIFAALALVMAAILPGCRKSTTPEKLTDIYQRETSDYQTACQDRDEQDRVIEELERLDLALPAADREQAHTEIAKLEELRRRLNENIEHQAVRLAETKTALAQANEKH